VTHTLRIAAEDGDLSLPLIVRPIEGGEQRDAISPYGYPGASVAPHDPPDPRRIDWSPTGLVSVFVRDRIGERPCFASGNPRATVHVADPRAESGLRKRLAEQIRRNERRGWSVAAEPGPQAEREDLRAFEVAYSETMARTGAPERYLYPSEYFEAVLSAPAAWLLLAGRDGRAPRAGAIAASSDGFLHYYLGGTADDALEDSPMKNVFAAMISLAGELGLSLNLGGGVSPGDSLDDFKRGFANDSAAFVTHEVVCDEAAYEELSSRATPAQEGYFPAYRAPS
jgi:Acetyltransferase (GNAT) domain